jgi:hypothetical protein
LEKESLVRVVGFIIQKLDVLSIQKGIVKRIFWRLPIQIFDKVRKFYLGDFREKHTS